MFWPKAEAGDGNVHAGCEPRCPGVGQRSLAGWTRRIGSIARAPMRFRRSRGDARRALLCCFPLAVFLVLAGDPFALIATLHDTRHLAEPMQLHYTPRSHFSRKVRILLDGLGVEVELIDAGNVAEASPAPYGPNPLMKVPTLIDGTQSIFDSDHIAAYLVRKFDPADRFDVLATDAETLNARVVMNGVMAAEVELILAERTGLDTRTHRRFDKLRESIHQGLAWLEARSGRWPRDPTYLAFHVVAMWDHLALYRVVELGFPRLHDCTNQWSSTPFIARSKPV